MQQPAHDLNRAMHDVTADLEREFGQVVPPDVVRQAVQQSFESFSGSRIQSFVPLLARRHARAHLRREAGAAPA
jgi:hypothetical protein